MAPRSVSPGVRAVAGPAALGISLKHGGTVMLMAMGLDQLQSHHRATASVKGSAA